MGYLNSVPFVQWQMDFHLRDFVEFCRAYIDDIVITSVTLDKHVHHLHAGFQSLVKLNLMMEPAKSYIGYQSVQLLGQHVDAFRLATLDEKTRAIADLEFPKTIQQLETYLGMTGTLRHFIRHYTYLLEPLEERKALLLKGIPVKGWPRREFARAMSLAQPSQAELDAFAMLQKLFTERLWLTHFSRDRQLYVDIDASKERGHGAMVSHAKGVHAEPARPPR